MITNPLIVAELERIAEQNGGVLKAEAVVLAARPEWSPLHTWFEWDDTAAAERWRLHQARGLINVVVKYHETAPDKRVPMKVFVSLTPDREEDGGGYRVATTVLSDEAMRAQMLADAKQEMRNFKTKYERLTELAEVFEAMERVELPLGIPA